MAVYKRDIVDINLETGNIHRSFLKHSIGYMDQKADHFGIRAYRDGVPVDLTGVSVQGVFMPPQGSPIAITTGNIVDGNEAEVVLPQACYNYDGQFTLSIKLVDVSNSITGTMRIVDGIVDNTHASGTVAPTDAVPTYQEILAVYDDLLEALDDVADYAENFAPTFAAGTANAAGSYVMYEGDLYLLPDGHTANTTWANTTKTQVTTGGEMVKLAQADSDLKSAIERETTDINNLNGYAKNVENMILNTYLQWTTTGSGDHIIIPINPGDSISVTANADQVTIIAFLTDYTTPVNGAYASLSSVTGFTGRITITKNTSASYTAPSDAQYLYVLNTSSGYNFLPKNVIINGFDMFSAVRGGLRGYPITLDKSGITDVDNLDYNKVYLRSSTSVSISNIPYTNWIGIIKTYSYNEKSGAGAFQVALSKNGEIHIRRLFGSPATWSDWFNFPNKDAIPAIVTKTEKENKGIALEYSGAFTSAYSSIVIQYFLKKNTTYTIEFTSKRTGAINVYPAGLNTDYKSCPTYVNYTRFTTDNTDRWLVIYNAGGQVEDVSFVLYEGLCLDRHPEYTVSKDSHFGDYTSYTQCLLDLKDDETEKTVTVWEGDYDIYQEYTDAEVPVCPSDVNPTTNYWDYCVFVPTNTHIIGKGIVRLKWMPTLENNPEITVNQCKAVSVVNVAGTMTLENVEIHCKNGRYCIHNDSMGKLQYIGAVQHYKNVKCFKYPNETQDNVNYYGFTPATGFGIDRAMHHIYDDCIFVNYSSGYAFYGHGRNATGGSALTENQSSEITINNCAMETIGTTGIKFGNGDNDNVHIRVLLNNCAVEKPIRLINEATAAQAKRNEFDLTMLNCGNVSIEVEDQNNPYPPKAYRTTVTTI